MASFVTSHKAQCVRLPSLAALVLSGCFYAGGGARTTFDTKSREPSYTAQGYFGAFYAQGATGESFGPVDGAHAFAFSLAMGAGFDQRLERWQAVFGPRMTWLFPHGMAELGFETRFGASDPQLFGFMLRVGPRLEIAHSYSPATRTSHVIQLPVSAGFSVGDGFRPELGAGVDYHLHAWRPQARYD